MRDGCGGLTMRLATNKGRCPMAACRARREMPNRQAKLPRGKQRIRRVRYGISAPIEDRIRE